MSEADIERVARAAIVANANVPGNYINRKELVCRMTGIRAEEEFAAMYHLPYDPQRAAKRGSDGGYDFEAFFSGYRLTFDIKCRDGKWDDLLVQPNKFKHGGLADYFVAARYFNQKIEWLGWIDWKFVRACPINNKLPEPAHHCYRDELRPMLELDQLMMRHDHFARPA
jgi:hypothetical protein